MCSQTCVLQFGLIPISLLAANFTGVVVGNKVPKNLTFLSSKVNCTFFGRTATFFAYRVSFVRDEKMPSFFFSASSTVGLQNAQLCKSRRDARDTADRVKVRVADGRCRLRKLDRASFYLRAAVCSTWALARLVSDRCNCMRRAA